MVVNKVPCSLSVLLSMPVYMDYTSTLETLEGLSNALARNCAHHVGVLQMIYTIVEVREAQKLLMLVNKAHGSLYFDS